MKSRLLKSLLASLVAACGISVANAASVASQFFGGFQQLSDNSAEYLINSDGSLCSGIVGSCTVDTGDRLVGIFNIATIEKGGVTNQVGTGGVNELSGTFDITVVSKVSLGGGAFLFTFAATDGSGIAIRLFEDTTPDYQRTDGGSGTKVGRIAALTATADGTGASLWMTLGLAGAGTWTAITTAGDDISVIGAIPAPGNGGLFNVGLNIITNSSGLTFGKVACSLGGSVDVCGSGSLLGTAGNTTPFDSFDNVDFSVNVIPEPGTLALLGLSILGLAGVRRRLGKVD